MASTLSSMHSSFSEHLRRSFGDAGRMQPRRRNVPPVQLNLPRKAYPFLLLVVCFIFFNVPFYKSITIGTDTFATASSLLRSFEVLQRIPTANKLDQCDNTIVSAYFRMKSKHGSDKYDAWMQNFLSLQDCMVIYTDDEMAEKIISKREDKLPRTVLYRMSPEDLPIAKVGGKGFWSNQLEIDKEKKLHKSFRVFWIWLSKSWWVVQSIHANPFGSSFFMWSDFGCFRNPGFNHKMIIQQPDVIPPGRVAWMAHRKPNFPPSPLWTDKFGQKQFYFHSGSQGAGTKDAWLQFHKAFVTTVDKFISKDLFIGEDQCVLQGTCQSNPKLCAYLPSSQVKDNNYFGLRYALYHPGNYSWWMPEDHLP